LINPRADGVFGAPPMRTLRRGRGRGSSFDRDSDARARARSDGFFGGGSLRAPRMGSSKDGIGHFFDRRAGVVRLRNALPTTDWCPVGYACWQGCWRFVAAHN